MFCKTTKHSSCAKQNCTKMHTSIQSIFVQFCLEQEKFEMLHKGFRGSLSLQRTKESGPFLKRFLQITRIIRQRFLVVPPCPISPIDLPNVPQHIPIRLLVHLVQYWFQTTSNLGQKR